MNHTSCERIDVQKVSDDASQIFIMAQGDYNGEGWDDTSTFHLSRKMEPPIHLRELRQLSKPFRSTRALNSWHYFKLVISAFLLMFAFMLIEFAFPCGCYVWNVIYSNSQHRARKKILHNFSFHSKPQIITRWDFHKTQICIYERCQSKNHIRPMLMEAKITNLLHSIFYKQLCGMRHEFVYQMGAKWEGADNRNSWKRTWAKSFRKTFSSSSFYANVKTQEQ